MKYIHFFLAMNIAIISQQALGMFFSASVWKNESTINTNMNEYYTTPLTNQRDPIYNYRAIEDYEKSNGAQDLFGEFYKRQRQEKQRKEEEKQKEEVIRRDTANTTPGKEKNNRAQARQIAFRKKEQKREQHQLNKQKKQRAFLEK